MRKHSLILVALVACEAPAPEDVATTARPVINGALETGYPAVGALVVRREDRDPSGSFCSATLIDPEWVLTAAHCVNTRTDVHFYVGADAREPEVSEVHPARAIHVHPGYAFENAQRLYDIALVELAEPLDGVDPIPIHRDPLPAGLGTDIFFVGFGQSNPDGGGSGRKRSATLVLESVAPVSFVTRQEMGGVCFGDSGGPGLIDVGGTWEVAGVNSTVVGDPACFGRSNQIRADAYQSWIDTVMGHGTSCLDDPSICSCDRACGANGICDNAQCGNQGCVELRSCINRCFTSECAVLCLARADPEANHLYLALANCTATRCPDRDPECVASECRRDVYGCEAGLDAVTGDEDCGTIFRCSERCEDAECVDACFYEGTLATQEAFERVESCAVACEDTESDFTTCRARTCRARLLDCMPDEACRMTGGSCEDDTACLPDAWSATYCRPTEGLAVGEVCTTSEPSCVDGAICANGRCREVCTNARDCASTYGPCAPLDTMDLDFTIGVCALDCPDADGDGACDDEDCHPMNPSISPLAPERCNGDGWDENCDGRVDEGCEAPAPPTPIDTSEGCTCTGRRAPSALGLVLLLGVVALLVRRKPFLLVLLAALAGCSFGELPTTDIPGLRDAGTRVYEPPPAVPTIFGIQQGDFDPGTEVVLADVIVSSPEDVSGFFVSDGTRRPHSGLWIRTARTWPLPHVARGDVVTLIGVVEESYSSTVGATPSRTQLFVLGPDNITVTGRGELAPPVLRSTYELGLPEIAELYEGVIVRIEDVEVTARSRERGTLELDGLIEIDDLFTTFDASWIDRGTRFDAVTGALHHDARGFFVLPRDAGDLERTAAEPIDCSPTGGYVLCTGRRNFGAARQHCARQGGRLAVLETAEENVALGRRIRPFTDRPFWIGATDSFTEGEWVWVDGSTLTYDPWASGEPNNAGSGEDCAHNNWRGDGEWNDANCGSRQRFVCEFERPMRCFRDEQCPDGAENCVNGDCQP